MRTIIIPLPFVVSLSCRAVVIIAVMVCPSSLGQLIQKSTNSVDPGFDSHVAKPAYSASGPRVLLDQGHFNLMTAVGECIDLTFAKLIASDGYHVVRNTAQFDADRLRTAKIVVIPIAAGGNTNETVARPALTEREVESVIDWINQGGSLFLMFDHYPYDAAIEGLARRLGLAVTRGRVYPGEKQAPNIFSREEGLQSHPILEGRNAGERLARVATFAGSSFTASDPRSEFLKLPASAKNVTMPGLGRAQGAAFRLGKGRVVALADTNMAAAQLGGGDASHSIGLRYPGVDNRQLVLNVMHWLSGLLD